MSNPGLQVLSAIADFTVADFVKEEERKLAELTRNERMWELYKGYVACETYAEMRDYIFKHAVINKSKFLSMSKRRQKRFLDFEFGLYCDIKQDKLVPRYRRNQRWIVRINPVFKFVEQTGKPFNNMMEAWMGCLLGEG